MPTCFGVNSKRRERPEPTVGVLTSIETERQVELPDSCRHVTWVGPRVLAACDDGSLLIDEHPSGALLPLAQLDSPPTSLSSDTLHVACGALDGSLFVSSLSEPKLRFPRRVGAVAHVGARLVVANGRDVEVLTGPRSEPIDLDIGVVTGIASVTGVMTAIAGCEGLAWYDVSSQVSDGRIELPTVVAIAADPRGRCVALGDLGGSVHVVTAGTEEAVELTGFPDRVSLLGWVSSGSALCVIADDELTVWDADDDGLIRHDQPHQMIAHHVMVTALAPAPSDQLIATGDASGIVHVWSPTLVDLPVATLTARGTVLALAWRPDGRALAITTASGELTIVSVRSGRLA